MGWQHLAKRLQRCMKIKLNEWRYVLEGVFSTLTKQALESSTGKYPFPPLNSNSHKLPVIAWNCYSFEEIMFMSLQSFVQCLGSHHPVL